MGWQAGVVLKNISPPLHLLYMTAVDLIVQKQFKKDKYLYNIVIFVCLSVFSLDTTSPVLLLRHEKKTPNKYLGVTLHQLQF